MSNEILSLDVALLEAVTGGTSASSLGEGSNNIDSLLTQLHSITGSLDDFKKKTGGLGNGEMLMLCALAMRNNNQQAAANTVVVVPGPRRWW